MAVILYFMELIGIKGGQDTIVADSMTQHLIGYAFMFFDNLEMLKKMW